MKRFFAELRRRNVCKVAVAYAVDGWLLIQIATQVFRKLTSSTFAPSRFQREGLGLGKEVTNETWMRSELVDRTV
jgi:uncharacterized protein YjhX (UPF0386 family)